MQKNIKAHLMPVGAEEAGRPMVIRDESGHYYKITMMEADSLAAADPADIATPPAGTTNLAEAPLPTKGALPTGDGGAHEPAGGGPAKASNASRIPGPAGAQG